MSRPVIDLETAVRGSQQATAAVTRLRKLADGREAASAKGNERLAVQVAAMMTDVIDELDEAGLLGVALVIALVPELAAGGDLR